MEHLASTKVSLPRLRADLVARPRLQAQLGEALARRKLVLLSAPAGYGKTMALLQQLSRLPAGHAVAWVSASEDDDLQRLLATLLEALDPFDLPWRVSPDVLPAMALREEQSAAVVEELAHALALAEADHGVMAFDDMHRIADPRVFSFLDRLLRVLPAKWTVAIVSRVDPPMALARLLVGQELAEFRQEDLRFERDEVKALLQAAQLPATPERVEQLLQRTQGWVVGLNIELLAQAPAQQPAGPRARRRIFEYLAQEVFEQLPSPMQGFLLRCSVLPEFTVKRCAQVSGDPNAARWLDELQRRELFVTALACEELTLRLHDLFREYLEGRLTQEHLDELPALLRRAAQGEPDLVRRVGYLLRAGAAEEAAREMLQAASSMIHAGSSDQLIRLIEQFPQAVRKESPDLGFVGGLCAWDRFEFGAMCQSMLAAMSGFEREGRWQLALQARGLASIALHMTARVRASFELWDAAPSVDMQPPAEAVSELLAVLRSAQRGPYQSTPEHLTRLVKLIRTLDSDYWTTFFHLHYAYVGRWGMRAPTEALVNVLLASARDSRPEMKLSALKLQAWLAMWRGDVGAARALGSEVLEEARWLGNPLSLVLPSQVLMAVERHLSGDHPAASRILQDLADAAGRNPGRKARLLYINLLGGLAAAAEDWAGAGEALQAIDASTDTLEWPFLTLQTATLRAELALHRGDAAQALSLLRPLVDGAMDADHYGLNARLRVALARSELRAGTPHAAWQTLGPAIRQAMDAGEPLGLLLCGARALDELVHARWPAAADAPALAYLRGCAHRVLQLRSGSAASVPAPAPDSALSEREREVLQLVAQGQSNKLIARGLNLSPHTVKRHMARIFDKTGQSSRGQVAAWYRAEGERRAAVD